MSGEVNVAANRLLALFEANPEAIRSVREIMLELRLPEATARQAITVLRRRGYNVRNRRGVGFWLKDKVAPPLGAPGSTADDRWQS